MKLQWIKDILGDVYTEDIDAKVCTALGERFVARADFNDKTAKLKEAETQVSQLISADEYARIRGACIRQVPVAGKKGQYTQQLDTYTFQARVAARCTVFPDLNNAELQNSWGVAKPEELIGKLLIGGEFDDYVTEVFQHNGFKTEDELVNDAKN